MKAKKTYILPDTCHVVLSTRDKVLQDTLQDTFSGGDSLDTGIVIGGGADDSEDDNRANMWTNHLWDD